MKAPAASRHRPLSGQLLRAGDLPHATVAHRSTGGAGGTSGVGGVGDVAEASCEEIFDRVSGPFGTSLRAGGGGRRAQGPQ